MQDLFIEKPNPANADEFEFMGAFEPAQIVEETIKVAGGESVSLRVKITRHGPILNEASSDLKTRPPMALRWTALDKMNLLDSVLGVDRAQNFDQFRAALRMWDAPSQNFVFADVDGNIGYQAPGRIPIRKKCNGDMPVPGWTGEYEWTGMIPFEELPTLFNPPQGFVATANNAVVDSGYKYFISNDWDYGYRARRITELIKSRDKVSADDIANIQDDPRSGLADDIMPAVVTTLGELPGADATTTRAWEYLRKWDHNDWRDSAGAIIFEVFWNKLAHAVFDDELGEALVTRGVIDMGSASKMALRTVVRDPTARWWDDSTTPDMREQRAQIMRRAFDATIAQLSTTLGPDPARWKWGTLRTATFKNQTLGQSGIAPIEKIFNRGPFAVDGASGDVNANSSGESLSVTSVPSMRMIADVSDLSRSRFIHTTVQSGHPFASHYDDFINAWQSTQYYPLSWTRSDVNAMAVDTLVLSP